LDLFIIIFFLFVAKRLLDSQTAKNCVLNVGVLLQEQVRLSAMICMLIFS